MRELEDVQQIIDYLCKELVVNTIDLRFKNGQWSVMCPVGNQMVCVPNTLADSPLISLNLAQVRWDNRSPETPFIMWGGKDPFTA